MRLLDSLAPDLSAPGHQYLRGDFASTAGEDGVEGSSVADRLRDMELYRHRTRPCWRWPTGPT
ncbi:hypothetical protein QJS66_02760 [Kocuria rhizophila]|nr:hypothetical protein QJS66_02760 [Kocuria rhizophila]